MTTHKLHTLNDLPVPTHAIGKDEMNLCELPIAKLGRRDKREIIEFVGEVVKNGQTIAQEWTVRGAAGLGLPTEFAERVLVALISLAAKQGFQTEKTSFTVYEILKLMGLGTGGHYYQEVSMALQRLHGVTITGKNTWWDNDKKKYRTIRKGFGLIDNYWLESLSDEDDDENETGMGGYVVWNEWLWESFRAGYIKNIDTQFYYGLENTLARRLYRFLDKRMHYKDSYQIDIFALAARLGMAEYQHPSKVKEKLQPAFDELIARNYLSQAEIIKVGKFTRVWFKRNRVGQPINSWDEVDETPENATEGHSDAKAPSNEEEAVQTHNDRLAALYDQYETADELKTAWADILQEWKHSMVKETYFRIADSVLLAVTDTTAVIAVPPAMSEWIEHRLSRKIINNLTLSLKTKIADIEFVLLS